VQLFFALWNLNTGRDLLIDGSSNELIESFVLPLVSVFRLALGVALVSASFFSKISDRSHFARLLLIYFAAELYFAFWRPHFLSQDFLSAYQSFSVAQLAAVTYVSFAAL